MQGNAAGDGALVLRSRPRRSVGPLPYVLVSPAVAVVVVVALVPLAYGFWLSLTDWNLMRSSAPALRGLEAYARLLSDGTFWASVVRTCTWTLGTVLIELAVGLLLALLLNIRTRVSGVLTGLQLLPWVTPYVVVVHAWRSLLDGQAGPLHALLQAVGLAGEQSVLSDPNAALVAVIVISGWAGVPFMTIALLAALKSIPKELYEAASVDGAGPWARFANITAPFIRSTATIMGLVLGILAFYSFDIVWLTTKGGPVGSTDILGVELYNTFVSDLQPGYAAAMGMAALVILAAVGIVVIAWSQRGTK
jgi:ABC-type sugar transport system permease subunit